MDACCDRKQSELAQIASKQKAVLRTVLLINLVMFGVEAVYGWVAQSTALLADSLDMLGDALVYALSLYAIGRGPRWLAATSALKGSLMSLFGVGVLADALRRFFEGSVPHPQTMGWVGALALIANLSCALLLLRHRDDDINMRSTWLCSRNDVIANVGVLAAAGAVLITQSPYPDLVVGVTIAAVVLQSSVQVLRESRRALA